MPNQASPLPSMAVAPVQSSQDTTTENSTLPAVDIAEEEEVDTFLQVISPHMCNG